MIPESLLKQVRDTTERSREARNRNKTKHRPSAWRRIWEDALRKQYPHSVVAYSARVAANLTRAVEKRGFPKEDMGKFIEWVVMNWPYLRKSVFSFNPRIPRGPETPDMDFVIFNLPRLHTAFNAAKPEHAATRYIPGTSQAALAAPEAKPVTPLPAKPAKPPAATLRGFTRGPAPKLDIDFAKARATQKRLGFKTWD